MIDLLIIDCILGLCIFGLLLRIEKLEEWKRHIESKVNKQT